MRGPVVLMFVGIAAVLALAAAGCPQEEAPDCVASPPTTPGLHTCRVEGYPDRSFDLNLPSPPDAAAPFPVIVALHGGGGRKETAASVTCPVNKPDDPGCLSAVAGAAGFAVAYPNGTGAVWAPFLRTWNAGGGVESWQCVSGDACKAGVDDVAYIRAFLDTLARVIPTDPTRLFATGISNGGAMSYRLACELADRFAAIAPVAGANQQITSGACTPSQPVAILHIHGTADPCWSFDGGPAACAQTDGMNKISVPTTIRGDTTFEGWVQRSGCAGDPTRVDLPDSVDDGTVSHEDRYSGCAAPLILLTVEGGGHTWPGGWPYGDVEDIGIVAQDFSASERMVAFFLENGR